MADEGPVPQSFQQAGGNTHVDLSSPAFQGMATAAELAKMQVGVQQARQQLQQQAEDHQLKTVSYTTEALINAANYSGPAAKAEFAKAQQAAQIAGINIDPNFPAYAKEHQNQVMQALVSFAKEPDVTKNPEGFAKLSQLLQEPGMQTAKEAFEYVKAIQDTKVKGQFGLAQARANAGSRIVVAGIRGPEAQLKANEGAYNRIESDPTKTPEQKTDEKSAVFKGYGQLQNAKTRLQLLQEKFGIAQGNVIAKAEHDAEQQPAVANTNTFLARAEPMLATIKDIQAKKQPVLVRDLMRMQEEVATAVTGGKVLPETRVKRELFLGYEDQAKSWMSRWHGYEDAEANPQEVQLVMDRLQTLADESKSGRDRAYRALLERRASVPSFKKIFTPAAINEIMQHMNSKNAPQATPSELPPAQTQKKNFAPEQIQAMVQAGGAAKTKAYLMQIGGYSDQEAAAAVGGQ